MKAPTVPALLCAKSLDVALGGRLILRDVSLPIQKASLVAIVGPNGSGKSTLLRALAGLLPSSSGSIELAGQPISRYRRRDVARILSYVPQDTRVEFGFTVRQIVAMGRHPHMGRFAGETQRDHDAIDRGLALCDVDHLRNRQINTLSGGERQRALIARCLAAETPCILLDEPTASLDLEHALDIFTLARKLADAGSAIVLCTHDLNNGLRFGTSLVVLRQGVVAFASSGSTSPKQGMPPEEQTDTERTTVEPSVIEPSVIEAVFGVRAEAVLSANGTPHYVFHPKDHHS